MRQPGEDRIGRPRLDDPAGIHDVHRLGDRRDHAQIVGDQQQRHAGLVRDLADQLEDLGLHRHVERGGRLVGDQQLRPPRQDHGDHHPLALAARELVRVEVGREARRIEPHPRHRAACRGLGLGPPDAAGPAQPLGDLPADRVDRVQCRHRLLEDHADLGPPDPPERCVVEPEQITTREDAPGRASGPGPAGGP